MKILNSCGLDVRIDVGPQGSLTDPIVAPNLPGAVFDQQGVGTFPLNGVLSGVRGSITVTLITGTAGTARTVLFLTESASINDTVLIALDSSNRPFAGITDNAAVVKGQTAGSGAAIAAGQPLTIRLAWDSTQAIDGARFTLLRLEPNTLTNWTTNPVAAWTPFLPTLLISGQGVSGGSDFNGTILSIQASNQTILGSTVNTPGVLR